ncbi:MAG TPA: hypothetical protein VN040_16035 [Pseudosphingobacterium sp.]|nr:hypothetical protein [Pseudosphingobacterium sp.]
MYDHTLLQLIDDYFLPKSYRGAPDFIREFHEYVMPLLYEVKTFKNNVLFTQHSIPTSIYFLLSGIAYSTMEFRYRKMLLSPFLWKGPAVIGDGKNYYKQKPAHFGVALQGYAQVYALERRHLRLIEDKFPDIRPHIRLAIRQQHKVLKSWRETLSHEKAIVRLQHLLEQDPELLRHVLKKHVASHLGIYESYCSLLLRNYDR